MLGLAELFRRPANDLLTASEVCEILRVSRRTLYRLIDRKYLPCTKIGGTYRFQVGDVREYCMTTVRGAPFYFKTEVMQRYTASPDKYIVVKLPQGRGYIQAQLVLAGGTRTCVIYYYERTLPDGEKVIMLTPQQYQNMPVPERLHWQSFEMT